MKHFNRAAILAALLSATPAFASSALGTGFLFECFECTPAVAERFVGKAGPGDYRLIADDYAWNEVDIEASTISIKSLVEGYTRSPLTFRLTWSPEEFRLLDVSVAANSTFGASYSWGAGELVVDMSGQYFEQGAFITFELVAAPVPEPAPWLLGVGALGLLAGWRVTKREQP